MADSDDGTSTLTISPQDRDAIVRTVLGEAANQGSLGQAAVAHAIMNRTIDGGYGPTPTDVVLAPNQFEPWQTRGAELDAISPRSPQYMRAAKVVDGVLSGDIPDPTNGATQFLNPDIVMARYGRLPTWASGDGVQIGQHVFLGGREAPSNSSAPDAPSAISAAIHAPPQAGVGGVASGVLAFAPDGLTPAVQGKPISCDATLGPAAGQPAPVGNGQMSDADLEALITGAPAGGQPQQSAPGVRFATPPASAPAPNPANMSDGDLEKLLIGGGAAPGSAGGGSPAYAARKPILSPAELASGVGPQTGERVVGGKPFTSDSSHWNGAINFANGALQGAGTDLMAGVAALKAKLSGNEPKSLGDLYDQAKSTYQGSRQEYAAANPGTAAATEIGGSLATAVPAMAAGGSGLAATGNVLLDGARALPILARAAPAAEAAGSFLAGDAGAGGTGAANLLLRGASLGANGAVQGGTAAAMASGLSDQPFADQVKQGAELGGVVGVGMPAAYAGLRSTGNRLLGAGAVSPETAQLAQTARQYGISVRPGQITDSPGVRFMDSTLSRTPGMGYGGEAATQGTAFNRAVANTMGETADRITPAVMSAARSRIGASLDDVASRTTIQQDHPFIAALTNIANDAHGVLADSELRPLQTQMQNVLSKFSPSGQMTGEAYQALTRTGAPLDRLQSSSDSNLRYYANRVRDALDDTMERSASPDVLQQLQQARREYKAMKTIEPLVEKSTTGDVSPAALMQAVRISYNGMAYGGGGPLGDLARVGQRFLKEPPSSGTAERLQAQGTAGRITDGLRTLGGLGAATVGLREAAPYAAPYVAPEAILPTLAAMGGSYLGGRAMSSVLRSPAVANMLIDRALGNPSVPGPAGNALLAGIEAAPAALPLAYNRLLPPRATSP